MKLLKIIEIKEFSEYALLDEKENRTYDLMLEFHSKIKPKVGDMLVINEKLLDPSFEGFCKPYAFIDCDKKLEDIGEELEYIVIYSSHKTYILKRIYG